MRGIQHKTSVVGPYFRCMKTMAKFQAIRCEEARSIQEVLKVRELFSEVGKTGSFCRNEGVHIRTTVRKKHANDRLKDPFLSQHAFFLEDALLESTTVLGKVYSIFSFEKHHDLYQGISMQLRECKFWFLGPNILMIKLCRAVEQWKPLI